MSRKRKAYSIAEKLKIVDRIRKGETQAKASKELGISDSTIRGWLKEEDRLRGASTTMEDCGKPRKRARHARDQQLEKAVCTWVNQARSEGMQISGSVIQAQARKMHQDLHGVAASFEASKGWLHRFKGRNSTSKAAIKVEHCHKEIDSVKNPLNTQEPIMSISELRLTKPAPEWSGTAVVNGEFKDIKLSDYRGKYVVFFFYPADFTFICPTEIIAYSERVEEFRAINCEVIAVSTDSHFSHLAWINTPRKQGGLGQMNIPLLADKTYDISKKYGVYKEDEGVSFRGLFIIDDKGNLRQITINDLPVGRNVDETLRLVQAFQFTDKHGEVCPANWKPGADTLKPDVKGSKSYFSKHF